MSNKKRIESIVTDIVLSIIAEYGFELVDVEYIKEVNKWFLRVYIDKPGGIDIDDCQTVSQRLSDQLDELDPIEESYYLEVSSPGLDRPLKKEKDFERYKDEEVEVRVFKAIDGNKIFEGRLQGLIDDKVVIKTAQDELLEFDRKEIAVVKRIIKF